MPHLTARDLRALGAIAWIVAGVGYLLLEAVAAFGFAGYSFAHNYISDLGVPTPQVFQGRSIDSPLAWLMNLAFIAHGALFAVAVLAFAASARTRRGRGTMLALGLVHAVGMTLVGTVHGSQESVDAGTAYLHGTGATMSIVGGNAAIAVAAVRVLHWRLVRAVRVVGVLFPLVGGLLLLVFKLDQSTGGAVPLDYGVWERGAVYPIMLAEISCGLSLLIGACTPRRAAPAPTESIVRSVRTWRVLDKPFTRRGRQS